MEINQNVAAGSQLPWLFLLSRVVCCSEALLAPLSPPREGLQCSTLTKHSISLVGVDPQSPSKHNVTFLFFWLLRAEIPRTQWNFWSSNTNIWNYINQFSQTALWEVSHCHPWWVNLWAPSAWCLSKPAMLSLQASARDLLMGQHLLNTDFHSPQLAKFVLKACLGVWQGFWWLVA